MINVCKLREIERVLKINKKYDGKLEKNYNGVKINCYYQIIDNKRLNNNKKFIDLMIKDFSTVAILTNT